MEPALGMLFRAGVLPLSRGIPRWGEVVAGQTVGVFPSRATLCDLLNHPVEMGMREEFQFGHEIDFPAFHFPGNRYLGVEVWELLCGGLGCRGECWAL